MSSHEEPYLPEAVWNKAIAPAARPSATLGVDAYADWLERHCTQPDGSPFVLHPWQREVLAGLGPVTPRRARRSGRPGCLWRP